MLHVYIITLFFFFNDPPTTEIYPFSLHDAFPIFHKMWSLAGKDCNCAVFSRHAALNAKRLPGITRLVFRDTVAVLTRMTDARSEEHTSELQSQSNLVCRLLLEKKKQTQ